MPQCRLCQHSDGCFLKPLQSEIKGVELKQYDLFKCGAGAVIMQSNFKKAVFWGAHSFATVALVNISI